MSQLRLDFANIAAALDGVNECDQNLFSRLGEVLCASFRALNRSRLEGRAGRDKLHPVLNYNYLVIQQQDAAGSTRSRRSGESVHLGKRQGPDPSPASSVVLKRSRQSRGLIFLL